MTTHHIYCDESCHLEHDGHKAMVLGAVRCPVASVREVAVSLRDLKVRHGLSPSFELKWTKISPGKVQYYRDVIDFFYEREDLAFRAVVIPDKSRLRHEAFDQSHDDFYYKVHFQLIRHWLDRAHDFRVFLDIKDTRSAEKTRRLREVLANSQGERALVALQDFSYVVVLDKRQGKDGQYLLLLTAFPVEHQHRRDKLRREHDEWKKAQTAAQKG